jgi:ubiquinone/menaquinone biosynthesis C-methylase UbiE
VNTGSQRDALISHYSSGYEAARLNNQCGLLERERTRELLVRFLHKPPARILDIGGGPGGYACWLAQKGYEVHLVDIVPLHVEMAIAASREQSEAPVISATVGDARSLSWESCTAEAVLLLGPLYHLTAKDDRLRALTEAHRVLKPGGILFAAGISRFASVMDGLRMGFLRDKRFAQIVDRDLKDGQHRNPTDEPMYFTDAFFHHPDELRSEVAEAGFAITGIYGVEGPAWLAQDFDNWWNTPEYRERLVKIARVMESDPAALAISAHLMAVASKP